MKKKVLVVLIILVVLLPTFAYASDLSKLDEGGAKILNIVQRIGYWIILIRCVADLIKAGVNGDTHSMGRIIMLNIILYGALFFVPWALKLVEGLF